MASVNSTPDKDDIDAPWGRDDEGNPHAPLGFKADGRPKISNRGRKAGGSTPSAPRARTTGGRSKTSNAERAGMLATMIDMFAVLPLAGASKSDGVAKRIGPKHAEALAGDAAIISHYRDPLVNGVMILAQSKPGVLAWMDSMEEKAPWLILAKVGIEMGNAIVRNHLTPDERLAEQGMETAQSVAQAMQNAA